MTGKSLIRILSVVLICCMTFTALPAVTAQAASGPEISISPDDGKVGTRVEVEGEDFEEDEEITVYFNGEEIDIESGDDEADGDGEFKFEIIIPEGPAGDNEIAVEGEDSEEEATETFEIEPDLEVSYSSEAHTGYFSATGLAASSNYKVYVDGDYIDLEYSTDGYGSTRGEQTFSLSVQPGVYTLTLEDDEDNEVEADFTVEFSATVVLSKTNGYPGLSTVVSGAGFAPNTYLSVSYDSAEQATTTSNNEGKFSVSLTIPTSSGGEHTITVSDGTNSESATFTIETDPPNMPQLLIPLNTTFATNVELSWLAVSDVSTPVTYTLQIARDLQFTASSMIIEKPGLQQTQYATSPTEYSAMVPQTGEDATYYWRVQAMDAAGNTSDWPSSAATGSFIVPAQSPTEQESTNGSSWMSEFTGGMPQWAIYVIVAMVIILIGLIGFLLGGRKPKY